MNSYEYRNHNIYKRTSLDGEWCFSSLIGGDYVTCISLQDMVRKIREHCYPIVIGGE